MARYFDGVNDDIIYGSNFSPTAGATTACWVNTSWLINDGLENIITFSTGGISEHYFRIWDIGTERLVSAWRSDSGQTWVRTTTNGAAPNGWGNDNLWHHICATLPAGATDGSGIQLYWDGVLQPMDAAWPGSGGTLLTSTRMQISGIPENETVQFTYNMAEVGVWHAELTAPEISLLGKGMSPSLIRPQSLSHYMPLMRDVQDYVRGDHISTTGTTVASHPRIIQSSAPQTVFPLPQGKIWVNDAPLKNGGEVLQTGANWSDTSITISPIVDVTGLSGQLYLGVEKLNGAITWRAITLSGVLITSVSTDDNVLDNETDWVIAGGGFGAR